MLIEEDVIVFNKVNLFDILPDEVDDKYTNKVDVPQYLPSAECPSIYSLYDDRKYKNLIHNIEVSNVPDDIKEFLRLGASRHIVFNYSKIADYYAHSNADVQKLFEESALVIIDMNDAIANGYVKLSSELESIMLKTGIPAKKG